jgi:hypothetical protein
MVRSFAHDPEAFRSSREQAAKVEFSQRYRRWLTEQLGPLPEGEYEMEPSINEAVLPRQPTLTQSRVILRAEDEHLRFGNAEDFVRQAIARLGADFASRARALTPRHRAVFDLTRSLRNSLAHASPRSSELLRRDTREEALPPSLRVTSQRNVRRDGIGAYLCRRHPATHRIRWRVLVGSLRGAVRTLDP